MNKNKKALKSLFDPQFVLFQLFLNELGINSFPFLGFKEMDETKLELLDLKNSAQILVPTEKALHNIVAKAKEENAHSIMYGGQSTGAKFYLRDSSLPFGCPAGAVSLRSIREPGDKEMKSTLNSEFIEYIDTVIKKFIVPNLDKLIANEAAAQSN